MKQETFDINNKAEGEQSSTFSINEVLRDTGKQGFRTVKWFLITLVLFGLLNTVFLLISIYNSTALNTKFYILMTLVTGLVLTALGLYFTYKYVLIEGLAFIYKYLELFFRKICVKLIDKVVSGGGRLLGNRDLDKSLHVGSLMVEIYGNKMPSYVRKSASFIVKRVPFGDFLTNMQDDLNQKKDNRTLSQILYGQLDNYIKKEILWTNNMKWLLWMLPLNLILQLLVLFWFGK